MVEIYVKSIVMIIWFFFGLLAYIGFMEINKWRLTSLFEYIISLVLIPLGLIGLLLYLDGKNKN